MPTQRLTGIGKSGLVVDLPPTQADGWSILRNVLTRDGSLESAPGTKALFSVTVTPEYHTAFRGPDGRSWAIVSDGALVQAMAMDDGSLKTLASGWAGGFVTFAPLNGVLIVNSETNGPFYWDYANADPEDRILVILPGWDATNWRCRAMAAYRYNLVALHMIEGGTPLPHRVRWSSSAPDGAIPTEWLPAVGNDAGGEVLGETMGHIVGAALVRDYLWIVKDDAIYSMQPAGLDAVFSITRLHGSVGTSLPRGFAEFFGGLVVFTGDDVFLFDGQNAKSIAQGRVSRILSAAIGDEAWYRTQVHVDSARTRFYLMGAQAGSLEIRNALVFDGAASAWAQLLFEEPIYGMDQALLYDQDGPIEDLWDGTELEELDTWDGGPADIWDQTFYRSATPATLIYRVDQVEVLQAESMAEAIPCFAERYGLPLGDINGLFTLTRVWPELKSNIPVILTFGVQLDENLPVRWGKPLTFDPATTQSLPQRLTGRTLAVRVESSEAGYWRLAGLKLEWQPAGER